MSTEDILALLSQQGTWEAFTSLVAKITARTASNMEMIASLEPITIRQIPRSWQDIRFDWWCMNRTSNISQVYHLFRRQKELKDRIPSGFHLVKSTGDGNCLFCSASLLLVGEESLASVLRLLAVVQAVTHFDHYLAKVSTNSYTIYILYKW